jgi:hypothetical protein
MVATAKIVERKDDFLPASGVLIPAAHASLQTVLSVRLSHGPTRIFSRRHEPLASNAYARTLKPTKSTN